ncbi:hypothetical protein LWC33_17165 [Pseudonocardia sp. RS11V-5]|uniref:hypothetical protein n=1 Tax=Pseudonocardia terrae TaxID=2905831 RepID=UPI001E3E44DD|nr:hypothetical protein [Pseudonocardia terrae]MCE3553179.1 hypothetical protein [Pseudonocardia terrae]
MSAASATNATRLIVLVATPFAVCASVDAAGGQRRETEHWVLLLGALGSVLMAGATDLLLFAAFLLASSPLYALVGWSATSTGTGSAPRPPRCSSASSPSSPPSSTAGWPG